MKEISVIIPCYNSEKTIERCIRSLLSQSLSKKLFEIIIIDDGSKNKLQELIKKYLPKIKIFTNKNNLGLPAALNKGIMHSIGRYIVRVDSDDYVHKDFLKILYLKLILSNNIIDAVSCDYIIVDTIEKNKIEKSFFHEPIGCGIMFKREILLDLGMYNEEFIMAEDEELLRRFLKKKYKLSNINIPLYRYTKHSENMTNDKSKYLSYKKKLNEIIS